MVRALLVASAALATVGAGASSVERPESIRGPEQVVVAVPELSTLLGFVDGKLVRIDPETLQPLPGKGIVIGSGGCAASQGGTACWTFPAWTISPDGTRLAVARNLSSSVRVVHVGRMRITADLPWGFDGGSIGALAWLAPQRVLAVQEAFGERERLIAFDLAKKRVVVRRALNGTVIQLGRTARELVLLLAPAESIGRARIAVVDPRGAVRFAHLERILVGSKLLGTGSQHRVDIRTPGLAVDPQSRRAFVVAQGLAAEVDLRTLAVSYHSLERPPSLLSRLWNWLEPAAYAKQVSGYHRQAQWLGADLVAVSGTDTEDGRYRAAGLLVIDTRTWSVRTIDRGAMSFEVAGDALLATGGSWDAASQRNVGIGVAAYGHDGEKRLHLFDGERAWVALVYDGRAYVGLTGSGQEPLRVVELATGRVLGTRQQPLPWLLVGVASGWWEG